MRTPLLVERTPLPRWRSGAAPVTQRPAPLHTQ